MAVRQAQAIDRAFGQTVEETRRCRGPHDGDAVDADVAECGRTAVHGVGCLFPHPAVFFGRAAAVVHIKNKRAEHALHYQIRQAQILDTAAAAAARLDAQTAVGTREHTVRDRDIAHAAAHLAADDYAAVSVHKQTVCNDDVLAGYGARRFLGAGFQCDAVIANVNAAVQDAHIAAAFGVDAVGVGRIVRVADGDILDQHIHTVQRMDGPRRAVAQLHAADAQVGDVFKMQQVGAAIG